MFAVSISRYDTNHGELYSYVFTSNAETKEEVTEYVEEWIEEDKEALLKTYATEGNEDEEEDYIECNFDYSFSICDVSDESKLIEELDETNAEHFA